MHRKIVLAGIVFLAFAGSYVGERALSQDHGFRRAKYGSGSLKDVYISGRSSFYDEMITLRKGRGQSNDFEGMGDRLIG